MRLLKGGSVLQLYHAKAETCSEDPDRSHWIRCNFTMPKRKLFRHPPGNLLEGRCNFTMPKRKLNSRLIIAGSAVRVATLPCLSNYIKYTTLFSLLQIKFNL